MAAGIAVVAAPVAIVGAGAYLYVKRKADLRLAAEKEQLLEEAEARRSALREKSNWQSAELGLRERVANIEVRLSDVIAHLKHDLGRKQ